LTHRSQTRARETTYHPELLAVPQKIGTCDLVFVPARAGARRSESPPLIATYAPGGQGHSCCRHWRSQFQLMSPLHSPETHTSWLRGTGQNENNPRFPSGLPNWYAPAPPCPAQVVSRKRIRQLVRPRKQQG